MLDGVFLKEYAAILTRVECQVILDVVDGLKYWLPAGLLLFEAKVLHDGFTRRENNSIANKNKA